MPESDEQQSLRKQNEELRQSINRAINTNSELALQLREALEGNKELQKQMALLQKKLDVLLAQTKKRNQKEYGPKTERHNPRPAASATLQREPAEGGTTPAQRNHEKHILSQDLPIERLAHDVEKDNLNCPDCLAETVTIGHKVTYQLERILQTLKKIEHVQEVRACSKAFH